MSISRIVLPLFFCAWFFTAPADAADYNLKFAHFYPPTNHHTRDMVPAWTQRIEKATGGKVTITQYPNAQLLKPGEIYDGLKSGVAEIGMVVPGLTPGRFAEISLVDLPFTFQHETAASRALMELYGNGMFAKDFADVQVLYLHVIDMSTIHTRNTPMKTPEDIKGLRIRFPSSAMKDLLGAYGAVPIGTPPTQIYESLERGVMDGYTGAWDSLNIFRLGELTKFHLDMPIYTLAVCICMNKGYYDKMPADLRKAIMDESGIGEAIRVGQSYEKAGQVAFRDLDKTKHTITKPAGADAETWRKPAAPLIEAQLQSLEAKGIKARESYKLLRETAAKYETK